MSATIRPANMKGPAIFLAQFAGDTAPFNSFDAICAWASSLGYKGVQIPSWDARLFDLKKASDSKTYCDEITGVAARHGLQITELSTHLQGQLVAVHPAYDIAFDGFAAPEVRGNSSARTEWAIDQVKRALRASKHLGLKAHATFSGALAWPYVYPWPQRPAGLVEAAFDDDRRRARVAASRARLERCRAIVRSPTASGPVAPLAAGDSGKTLRPSTHVTRRPSDRRRGAVAALAAQVTASAAIRAAG
jgi:hypothetical protein